MKRNHFPKHTGLAPREPIRRCVAARKDGLPCTNPVAEGDITCSRGHHDIPVTRQQIVLGLLYLVRPAYRVLASSLEDADASIRVRAAESILNRAGVGAHLTVHLADEGGEDLSTLTTEDLAARAATVLARLQAAAQTGQGGLQAPHSGAGSPQQGAPGTPPVRQLPATPDDTEAV